MPLADIQIDRYSRQILLPEIGTRGQERLIASSAAILGAGSLAHLCALYLAGAGVGRIGLLVPDSSSADADEALAQDLMELNPDVRIEHLLFPSLAPRPSHLAPSPFSLVPRPSPLVPRPSPLAPALAAFDVLVDTGRGAPISHELAAAAAETGRPFLAAGVCGSQGWLARQGGGDGCVVCVSLHEGEAAAERADAEPSPLGVVASLLAFETIATLLGWDERRGSWLHYDGAAMTLKAVRFAAHPDCAACGRQS